MKLEVSVSNKDEAVCVSVQARINMIICVFTSGVLVEENPAPCQILLLLAEGGPRPLTFVLNANLLVNVKLITCE